jgi:hypothetical protein
MATDLGRFRVHGDKIVWRVSDAAVTDCPCRPAAGAGEDNFVARFKSVCDDILARLRGRPQMTFAKDRRAQHDALEELNRKNAEFWSRQ